MRQRRRKKRRRSGSPQRREQRGGFERAGGLRLALRGRCRAPHVSLARSPDNAWLFVFAALVMCALSFALCATESADSRCGADSSPRQRQFESQHGYRGADESDDMEGDAEDTRKKGGGDEHSVSIVPALEVVADGGFKWAEGPLWVLRPGHEGDASYGRLLFSAVMDNSIFKLEYDGLSRFALASGCRDRERNSEKEQGACDALIEPGSNGLAYDPVDGGLFLCEHGSRSFTRLEENGTHSHSCMPKAANISTAPTIWCFRLAETFSLQTLLWASRCRAPSP